MHRKAGKRRDHADTILKPLAHTYYAAAADMDARCAHVFERVEPVLVRARGYDLTVELRRCVEIVIVVVESAILQPPRLIAAQHAERDASFHSKRLYALDHLADLVEIAVFRRAPCCTHAEARGPAGFRCARFGEHGIDIH